MLVFSPEAYGAHLGPSDAKEGLFLLLATVRWLFHYQGNPVCSGCRCYKNHLQFVNLTQKCTPVHALYIRQ